jgi:Tol biopolymer transport system component/C-terminal processing protease CtpA/Prc
MLTRATLGALLSLRAVSPLGAQAEVTPRAALSEPSVSPDGQEIAFVAGGDIWTVPAAGGIARLLITHPATESRPLWSPDGKQLAFVSTRTGGGDIYVYDFASGRVARRTFSDGREQLDAWSRDGAWLYFSSSSGDISGMNDVWRLPARGGQPAQVAADRYASEYWAAPSPDGTVLAITARGTTSGQWWRHGHSHLDESELWLVRSIDAATPVYERFGDAGNGKDTWPMWSADGKTIYYMSDRSGQENLWSRAVAGGDAKLLTHFANGRVLWPQIANDGKSIVFERDFGVWRYDVAKGTAAEVAITLRGAVSELNAERQVLAQGFSSLALAPDARKAAFVARGELFVGGTRDAGEATRLTSTTAVEADPAWFPDGRRLVYASNRDKAWNLFVQDAVSRAERALTTGQARSYGPRVSPDGKWVAYQRNGQEVRVVGVDGAGDRRVASAQLGEPPFANAGALTWSPDSKWIAYAARGADGFGNVYVVALDGTPPKQVTFGADANVGAVQWSPDGTFLLYRSAMRTEAPHVVRVDLIPHTPRFREDQYRELFGPTPRDSTVRDPAQRESAPRDTSARTMLARDTSARVATTSARKPVSIVFDGIRTRASVLPTAGLEIGAMAISPDGRTLALSAVTGGQQQLYTWPLDELARDPQLRALTTSPGGKASLQWSPDSRELWYLDAGRITALVVETRVTRMVAASAEVDVNFEGEKRAIFEQTWSTLANSFFDGTMHGADWAGLATRIAPYVEGARNPDDLRRVLSLMIGELNASHLGISGPTTGGVVVPVGRLGLRFDRVALENRSANGANGASAYVVREVIAQGPAAVAGLRVGDRVTSIDGVALRADVPLDSLLAGKVGRRVTLRVSAAAAPGVNANASGMAPVQRDVVVQPIPLNQEKDLLYRQWVEERRAYVAKASGGRLGYVHMFDMGQGALDQLYLDLDAENQGREGVVVDVRNNNGGFVNPYAIDVLARRSYLQFTPRGSTVTPARASLGQRTIERPTVLVTNQHTLSDGEDFTEGYRSLSLGKVVGEPTAGWIIFTSNVTLLDGTTSLRIPFTRVTDAKGRDMELHPRPVDVTVVRPVGESYGGRDSQLDAAVQALLPTLPKK